jgi:hypothetical protein
MNFGASRLGFWYNKPPDRGYKKDVLVFFDPLTYGPGGNTNYYNNTGDVKPATDVYPVIQAREATFGFTTTLVQSYAALKTLNLSNYAHIWDIGYASPYTSNPNDPTNILYSYLQGGGSMFMLGENAGFGVRDDAIDTFVTGIGGGNIVRTSVDISQSFLVTVVPEFVIANSSNTVVFNRPGAFTSLGSGTPMTSAYLSNNYVAVMWKTGSLSGATNGAIVSVLDINFFKGFSQNLPFIDNLIQSMNRR